MTEALIDVRVELPPEIDLAALETFHDAIRDRYPVRKDRLHWRAFVTPSEETAARPVEMAIDGYLFVSDDERRIVQARRDGFSFSQLKPYDSWETLRAEARALWGRFVEVAHPLRVTRVAVRYINQIDLPLPIVDEREYLRSFPLVAPGLPSMTNMAMRAVMPHTPSGATVILNQFANAPDGPGPLPFILDIDVFREETLAADGEDIWSRLDELRAIKNDFFFHSLTDKALEPYDV